MMCAHRHAISLRWCISTSSFSPPLIMRTVLLCALAVLPLVAGSVVDSSNIDGEWELAPMRARFAAFKATFGRSYASDDLDENRFKIFNKVQTRAQCSPQDDSRGVTRSR
jgi:hypothetical protein